MKNVFKDYIIWIVRDELNVRPRSNHTKLWNTLFQTPFEFSIAMDKNRRGDGISLRERYIRECEVDPGEFGDMKCSVLEVLAALAIRVDGEWIGDPSDPKPDALFVEMLGNLGLMQYSDQNFDKDAVEFILNKWMDREFDYDGDGSIFPIKHPDRDQRKIEIWKQMFAYTHEYLESV